MEVSACSNTNSYDPCVNKLQWVESVVVQSVVQVVHHTVATDVVLPSRVAVFSGTM